MSFPTYAHYKDSGVEWLGEVPAHWDLKPLKHLVDFRSGGTPDKTNREFWDGEVPWASAKDLKTDELFDTIDHITETAVSAGAASLVEPGAILVVVRGMILARLFPVVTARVPMAINQDLKALSVKPQIHPDFMAWMLRGSEAETLSRLDEAGHGTKALRMEAWGAMRLPVPDLTEQVRIVDFLKVETTKLDALITEQRTLIDLLKEKRQAVISHAVTKGLDPRVPMKDSGVEWLGEVPAHWEVVRVRHAVTIDNSPRFPINREERAEMAGQYPYWGPTGIIDHIDHFRYEGARALIGEDGDHFTKHAIWPMTQWATGQFNVNNHAHVIADGPKCLARWFYFSFLHRDIGNDLIAQGVSRLKLTREGLSNLWLAVPPLDEQVATMSHLEATIERQSEITQSAQRQISLLEERRSALISAAVTGKIDVRGTAFAS